MVSEPASRLAALNSRLAGSSNRRMVDALVADQRHRQTLDRLAAAVLATAVHLVTVCFAVGGVVLLVVGNWPVRAAGLVCLLIAFGTRPALPGRRLEQGALVVDPSRAPQLVDLVREVAVRIGAPVPTRILIIEDYNAYAALTGWRQRTLALGAPLWVSSSTDARLSLLGHELGHFAHGDVLQGRYVGSAYETLFHWADILRPGTHVVSFGNAGLDTTLAKLVLSLPRAVVEAYRGLMELVAAPSGRRQELHADLASARVAGTVGAVDGLEMLLAVEAVEVTMNRVAITDRRADLDAALRAWARTYDAVARRSERHYAEASRSRIDDSHPPTLERLRLVESTAETPLVSRAPSQWEAIDAELAPYLRTALGALADSYRG